MAGPAIGIDVGGTKIAGAVVAADGQILARSRLATEADSGQAIMAGIVKMAQELRAVAPAAIAIGVGAAGLVDTARGIVLGAPNIAYRNLHVRDDLAARAGLPVEVDNDANAAAWGEARFGAGRGIDDQIMVTVGTGIGGGLVLAGQMYRGGFGFGAEIGHLILDPEGPPCGCGARGCFEQMASGNAIGRLAREQAVLEPAAAAAALERAGGEIDAITGEIVGVLAIAGDEFCGAVVARAGRFLGIGLATLINIFDPQLIVVGGGAGVGTGELLLGPARASLEEYVTLRELRKRCEVVPAALGNDAGVIGAADLARRLVT